MRSPSYNQPQLGLVTWPMKNRVSRIRQRVCAHPRTSSRKWIDGQTSRQESRMIVAMREIGLAIRTLPSSNATSIHKAKVRRVHAIDIIKRCKTGYPIQSTRDPKWLGRTVADSERENPTCSGAGTGAGVAVKYCIAVQKALRRDRKPDAIPHRFRDTLRYAA